VERTGGRAALMTSYCLSPTVPISWWSDPRDKMQIVATTLLAASHVLNLLLLDPETLLELRGHSPPQISRIIEFPPESLSDWEVE
jgi:hypothetical protein